MRRRVYAPHKKWSLEMDDVLVKVYTDTRLLTQAARAVGVSTGAASHRLNALVKEGRIDKALLNVGRTKQEIGKKGFALRQKKAEPWEKITLKWKPMSAEDHAAMRNFYTPHEAPQSWIEAENRSKRFCQRVTKPAGQFSTCGCSLAGLYKNEVAK